MKHARVSSSGVFLLVLLAGGTALSDSRKPPPSNGPELTLPYPEIQGRLKRYVTADIGLPSWDLAGKTRDVVDRLVEAAGAIDLAYWDQVSEGGCQLLEQLSSREDPESRDYAAFLRQNYGPWDRIADQEPFIGHDLRPAGANLYPSDLSRREWDKWLIDHPGDRVLFESPYTTIRRADGRLTAVPYSKQYSDHMEVAAKALREAAELTDCWPQAQFLKARADALLSNDYRPSEMLWLNTASCPIDIAIGPYEVYEDQFLGLKTAFEAFVTVRDDLETAKAGILVKFAGELLSNLPLDNVQIMGKFDIIKPEPILVANEIFASGNARAGFQVRAFVLPNDEKVRREKGTKHVILENVVRARFVHLLQPLSELVLATDQVDQIDFDAYFKLMLSWELAHGLTPKSVAMPGGEGIAPRQLLRQRYSLIEAARAETVGVLNALFFVEKGVFPAKGAKSIPVTWLASLFESMRFGTTETQGQSKLLIYNYLAEADAFRYDPQTRRFRVNFDKLRDGLRSLVAELLTIELNGDYNRAGKLIVDYGLVSGEVRGKLTTLSKLPVDIRPKYTVLSR